MGDVEQIPRGIFSLPNEILLHILNLIPTRTLASLTPTCHHFHSLILRLIHNRLQIAADLHEHTLYLECHPPSARLTASKLFCSSLGTEGLQELLSGHSNENGCIGQIAKCATLYSRFQPKRTERHIGMLYRRPGDIPGSRTHPSSNPPPERVDPDDVVSTTVTVDAHDLFSQLIAFVYLGQREKSRGILVRMKGVGDGTIRVWRHWLSKQCKSKRWTDGEQIVVHHDAPSSPAGKGKGRADSVVSRLDPAKDPSILWINTQQENVGLKFRVKQQNWRRSNPVLYSSDEEIAVSYQVEFEEVLVRTTHLLLKLEDAQEQMDNHSGKAIIFGSFRRRED